MIDDRAGQATGIDVGDDLAGPSMGGEGGAKRQSAQKAKVAGGGELADGSFTGQRLKNRAGTGLFDTKGGFGVGIGDDIGLTGGIDGQAVDLFGAGSEVEEGAAAAIIGDIALDEGAGGQIGIGDIDEDAFIETADKIDRAAAVGGNSDVAIGADFGRQSQGLALDGKGA